MVNPGFLVLDQSATRRKLSQTCWFFGSGIRLRSERILGVNYSDLLVWETYSKVFYSSSRNAKPSCRTSRSVSRRRISSKDNINVVNPHIGNSPVDDASFANQRSSSRQRVLQRSGSGSFYFRSANGEAARAVHGFSVLTVTSNRNKRNVDFAHDLFTLRLTDFYEKVLESNL